MGTKTVTGGIGMANESTKTCLKKVSYLVTYGLHTNLVRTLLNKPE